MASVLAQKNRIYAGIAALLLFPLLSAGQPKDPHVNRLYQALAGAGNDTLVMEASKDLGSYYSLENRDSSTLYLERALSLAIKLKLKFSEATILNKLGVLQMQQEKYAKSLEYYLKAMHIAKDPAVEETIWNVSAGQRPADIRMLEISRSYDYIGLLNAYTGNWTENINNQMKNYREAEQYAQLSGDEDQVATVGFHIGIAHMNAGRLDSALAYLEQAISAFLKLENAQLGRAYIYLGETYKKMSKPELALESTVHALAILNQTNDEVHKGLGSISLSKLYADLGKKDSAVLLAREAFCIFEKRNDPAWKRDAANLLSVNFERLGSRDSAGKYMLLAKALSDSLGNEERKNLLAFQDVLIDEQLKLEKLEKERIETRARLRTYLLLSGVAVVLTIALFLYRNNRERKKTNEILSRQNQEIERALHQLKATQAQLIQSEKMASLGELTAGIAHEIQNPLNFVNNFSESTTELIEEMKANIKQGNFKEVDSIAGELESNLEKISHHGKRADGIVKGMLQHSRRSTGQLEETSLNTICEEYTRLAYHGFLAKHKDFNVQLETAFDPLVPGITLVPQDMGRVVLNLLNNAFFAVSDLAVQHDHKEGAAYQPRVVISTRNLGNDIQLSVTDNGKGIPMAIRDKVFQPFFTTKPTGQGTGLGLSLAYDIVKAHGGTLTLESQEGRGSTFTVKLPLNR